MDDKKTGRLKFRTTREADAELAGVSVVLGVVVTAGAFLATKFVQQRTMHAAEVLVNGSFDIALKNQDEK